MDTVSYVAVDANSTAGVIKFDGGVTVFVFRTEYAADAGTSSVGRL